MQLPPRTTTLKEAWVAVNGALAWKATAPGTFPLDIALPGGEDISVSVTVADDAPTPQPTPTPTPAPQPTPTPPKQPVLPSGGNLAAEARKAGNAIVLARGGVYAGTINPSSGVFIVAEDGDGPLPILNGRIEGINVKNVTIDGLDVRPVNKGGVTGIRFYCVAGLKILNSRVCGFGDKGIVVESEPGKPRNTDVVLRGNLIADNYPFVKDHHSAGAYVSYTDGLVVDGNVFSHNGGTPGVETVFNHNCYLHGSNGPSTVTNNVFEGASSHGLQQRSGGVCTGNVFLDNPIHLSDGLVNGEACFPGGITVTISRNLFVGGGDINGSPRGWGIQLGNLKSAAITDNIFAHDQKATGAVLMFERGNNLTNPKAEMPPQQWKVNVSGLYVYDRANQMMSMESGVKGLFTPTMAASVGKPPPKQPNLRDVLGAGFMPWARDFPAVAAIKAIEKAFSACGL